MADANDILSQYDDEARANLAASRAAPERIRPEEAYRGSILPFRETTNGKLEWAVPGIVHDAWDTAKSMASTVGLGTGPGVPFSQMSPESQEQFLGHTMAGALTGITGPGAIRAVAARPNPAGTFELGAGGGKRSLPATPAALPRDVDPLGYYSHAYEAARAWPQATGTPEQALAYLKKSGAKDAEIAATGLDQWLVSQDAVTRDALVKHLKDNKVGLNEKVYGNAEAGFRRELEDKFKSNTKWSRYATDGENPTYRETVLSVPPSRAKAKVEPMSPFGPRGEGEAMWEGRHPVSGVSEAPFEIGNQFGRITHWPETFDHRGQPSGPAYIINSPNMYARAASLDDAIRRIEDSYNRFGRSSMGRERADAFKSGHWDEPNVVSHMRSSVQKDVTGRPVFLLDELQSDWGQKLREGGVRDEAKIAKLTGQVKELAGLLGRDAIGLPSVEELKMARKPYADNVAAGRNVDYNSAFVRDFDNKILIASDPRVVDFKRIQAELFTAKSSTPGHPLVNTTDQWTSTSLRRALQLAAEAKAEGIALTPGKVHNERFGLERHFDSADVTPNDAGRRIVFRGKQGDSIAFDVDSAGIVSGGQLDTIGKPLAEVVGQEVADRIMSQDKPRTLVGTELAVGGEGMKHAYDVMYPKMLEKMLRKIDKEHPGRGEVRLVPHDFDPKGMVNVMGELDPMSKRYAQWQAYSKGTPYENPFHYFPLTDAVREAIAKGLPLFKQGGAVDDVLDRYGEPTDGR